MFSPDEVKLLEEKNCFSYWKNKKLFVYVERKNAARKPVVIYHGKSSCLPSSSVFVEKVSLLLGQPLSSDTTYCQECLASFELPLSKAHTKARRDVEYINLVDSLRQSLHCFNNTLEVKFPLSEIIPHGNLSAAITRLSNLNVSSAVLKTTKLAYKEALGVLAESYASLDAALKAADALAVSIVQQKALALAFPADSMLLFFTQDKSSNDFYRPSPQDLVGFINSWYDLYPKKGSAYTKKILIKQYNASLAKQYIPYVCKNKRKKEAFVRKLRKTAEYLSIFFDEFDVMLNSMVDRANIEQSYLESKTKYALIYFPNFFPNNRFLGTVLNSIALCFSPFIALDKSRLASGAINRVVIIPDFLFSLVKTYADLKHFITNDATVVWCDSLPDATVFELMFALLATMSVEKVDLSLVFNAASSLQ